MVDGNQNKKSNFASSPEYFMSQITCYFPLKNLIRFPWPICLVMKLSQEFLPLILPMHRLVSVLSYSGATANGDAL